MFYRLHLIMAIVQISICVYLLFRVLPVFLFPGIGGDTPLDSIIRNWLTMGGFLIGSIFVLTLTGLYDMISLWILLLIVPVLRKIIAYHKRWDNWSLAEWGKHLALKAVYMMERRKEWRTILKRFKVAIRNEWRQSGFTTLFALLVAFTALIIRVVPAYQHAAPFSRVWFDDLARVKGLLQQHYFSGGTAPGGLYSLASVFSYSARLSPELLMHISGALTIALLCLEIYWTLNYITESPPAALFGTLLFALFPTTIMPQLLETQVEANSLLLAICFALPTLILLIRRVQNHEISMAPLIMGVIATGFTNVFILFVFLMPVFSVILIYLLIKRRKKDILATLLLLVASVVTQVPFVIASIVKGFSIKHYFLSQLFATQSIGIYNRLLLPLSDLSLIYLCAAISFIVLTIFTSFFSRDKNLLSKTLLPAITAIMAMLYIASRSRVANWIDVDQLAPVYSVMIAILGGLMMGYLVSIFRIALNKGQRFLNGLGYTLSIVTVACLLWWQGGVTFSTMLPETEPDGFYEAYYRIITNNLPYTYAIVAPPIDQVQAANRSFFMDYKYFLEQYGRLDSMYTAQKRNRFRSVSNTTERITLPASIFVMLEKPTLKIIQPGILDNQTKIMEAMDRFLARYKQKPGHMVRTYYNDKEVRVVELINEPGASEISDVLWHVIPTGSLSDSLRILEK